MSQVFKKKCPRDLLNYKHTPKITHQQSLLKNPFYLFLTKPEGELVEYITRQRNYEPSFFIPRSPSFGGEKNHL
jgi:hypothetical protein